MSLKIWMINVGLAVLATYLGVNAAKEWSREIAVMEQPAPAAQEGQRPQVQKTPPALPREMPRKESFNVVVENNLFASEREEIKEEVKPAPAAQQAKPPQPEPEPVKVTFTLYGIIATKGAKKALLSFSEEQTAGRKQRPPDRQARPQAPQWYEVGEGEESWKIESIERDKVVVAVGKDKTVVPLYDKEKPKQRAAAVAKSQGPTVVTVATQAAASGQPAVIGEKGAGKEHESGEGATRSQHQETSEEKKQAAALKSRTGTSLSTRSSGESALRRDTLGRSDTSSTYPPSRLPPFVRQR